MIGDRPFEGVMEIITARVWDAAGGAVRDATWDVVRDRVWSGVRVVEDAVYDATETADVGIWAEGEAW